MCIWCHNLELSSADPRQSSIAGCQSELPQCCLLAVQDFQTADGGGNTALMTPWRSRTVPQIPEQHRVARALLPPDLVWKSCRLSVSLHNRCVAFSTHKLVAYTSLFVTHAVTCKSDLPANSRSYALFIAARVWQAHVSLGKGAERRLCSWQPRSWKQVSHHVPAHATCPWS